MLKTRWKAFILIGITVILAGCGGKNQTKKIEELENRLQMSERRLAELENKFMPLSSQVGNIRSIVDHLAAKASQADSARNQLRSTPSKPAAKSSKKSSAKKAPTKSSKKNSKNRR